MKLQTPNIHFIPILLLSLMSMYCKEVPSEMEESPMLELKIAHLAQGDKVAFDVIKTAFKKANPAYDLHYFDKINALDKLKQERVAFVQTGGGTATLTSGASSKFSIGDIIVLKPEEGLQTDSLASFLVFTVPQKVPDEIPTFIRPDWDENITDIPGGCATETNAYRRILLTWKKNVGRYRFHSLNAHRVRIMDSFSHYHPKIGGFDEFYLVQMAQPKAKLITSNKVEWIENPMTVTKEQTEELVRTTNLSVGDLVYLPRGLMHRGLDGVLAQVITVPGFIPGAEIGVDFHLKAINQNLKLEEDKQIPYNLEASDRVVIK